MTENVQRQSKLRERLLHTSDSMRFAGSLLSPSELFPSLPIITSCNAKGKCFVEYCISKKLNITL